MEVIGSITTWNYEVFLLIPSPVTKQPSLTSKGAFFAIQPFININKII